VLRVIACLACVAGTAAAAPRRVAIAPLSTLGAEDTSASARKLTGQLEAAVTALGDRVITAAQVTAAIQKARRPQLRACEGEAACLAELGRLVGAEIVIAGQVGGLGESRIVYLGATEVAGARELRSTTLAVSDAAAASGAITQLLEPGRYVGKLRLAIDVKNATIYVNGSRVAAAANGELTLPVGTQAVRITHPEYHDFVRFLDVRFAATTSVDVPMTQYPIVQRDVKGNPINRDSVIERQPPLWRRWYVVGPAAVGLTIVTAIIVGVVAHDVPDAPCKPVGGGVCR
jgi:hypothetical protein